MIRGIERRERERRDRKRIDMDTDCIRVREECY